MVNFNLCERPFHIPGLISGEYPLNCSHLVIFFYWVNFPHKIIDSILYILVHLYYTCIHKMKKQVTVTYFLQIMIIFLKLYYTLHRSDRVSYLLHAPFIIQNTRGVNLSLSSYKMQLDGLLVVYVRYELVLSAINH